jgi:hypothetical protein
MRKHVNFAIAATVLVLAAAFWTIINIETTAGAGRSRVAAPPNHVIHVAPTPYSSIKELEPVY